MFENAQKDERFLTSGNKEFIFEPIQKILHLIDVIQKKVDITLKKESQVY